MTVRNEPAVGHDEQPEVEPHGRRTHPRHFDARLRDLPDDAQERVRDIAEFPTGGPVCHDQGPFVLLVVGLPDELQLAAGNQVVRSISGRGVQIPDPGTVSSSTAPAEDEQPHSPRGNLIGEVGEVATINPTSDPELDLVTFSITEIVPDLVCTAPYAEPPQNGHYVGLSMDVATATNPEFTEHLYGNLFIASHSSKYVTAAGTTANDAVGNSYMCLDETQTLPSDIGPGEQVTGMVVLDLPATDGTVVFEEMSTGQTWEWEMPKA